MLAAAAQAEDVFGASCLTHTTAPTIRALADLDPDVCEIRPAAADDDDDVDDVDYGPEFTPRNELLLTPRYRADKKRKRPPSTSPAVISLSCGSRHTAVVVEDERTSRRAVYAWGWNAHGQCGTRDHLDVPYPVKIRRVLVHTGPRTTAFAW